ncbi:MAG: GUN4 domain-containing protein [Phormidium tanganyikae FI6-MK23]|jgi:hypothetical protein|nr:GUN4 domain-containing protein [Phormidium tanganyikae FI6-MK23]
MESLLSALITSLITAVIGTLFSAIVAASASIITALIQKDKYQDVADFFRKIRKFLKSILEKIFWISLGIFLTTFLLLILGGSLPFIADSSIPVENRNLTIKDKENSLPPSTSFSALGDSSIEVEIIKKPENGDVSVDQDHKITYKPKKFSEEDAFTYRVKVGKLFSKPAIVSVNGVSLTEQGYENLRRLLGTKNWKEADQTTKKIILGELNRYDKYGSNDISLSQIEVEQVCKHIKQLDQLWRDNSNGNFGFTAQAEIGRKIFSQLNMTDQSKLSTFVKKVGWQSLEKDYNELDFNFNSPTSKPRGYLPAFLGMRANEWRDFFQSIQSCSLKRFGGEIKVDE